MDYLRDDDISKWLNDSLFEEQATEFTEDLRDFCYLEDWESALQRIESLPDHLIRYESFLNDTKDGAFEDPLAALHLVICSNGPSVLVRKIIEISEGDPKNRQILSMRCGEGENTPLHFVAFRYNDVDTIRLMISKYPAALLAVNRYGRTPVETAKTKFAFQKKGNASLDVHPMECWATRRSNHVAIVKFLEQATESYGAWRNQLCVHCCANRLFLTEGVEPCVSWMGTESFFALNVIGMCLQNGMKAVALNIISFVGTKIGVNGQKSEEKDIRDSIEEENKALYLAQLTDFLDQVENRSSSSGRDLYKKLRKVGVNQYAKYALLLKRQYNCIPCGWQALYVEGYRKEKLEISQLAFSRIRGSFLLSANVASHNSSDTDSGRWRSPSNSDSDTSDSDSAIDSAKETNI